MELLRNVSGKLLRCGYTTGTCAAAAAKAAATMLLGGVIPEQVFLATPKGPVLVLDVLDARWQDGSASCAIRKDAGDDPDITAGALVYALVEKMQHGVRIDGGIGVGRVTKPGLNQPVGAAAINSVPREMIAQELREVAQIYGYEGGFSVTISIPGGAELAKHTFNPRLGIEGGLSIIGTTGIVEPMSNQALADTIRLELRQLRAAGMRDVLLTPGNYGEGFARTNLQLTMRNHINCANFIGDAVDSAAELGFKHILLVGHIGKLVKLGIGITNTHSAHGDGRMETLLACALAAGAELPLLQQIQASVTTDAALAQIAATGYLQSTLAELRQRIDDCLTRRIPADIAIGYVCFTNSPPLAGILVQSLNAAELCTIWRNND